MDIGSFSFFPATIVVSTERGTSSSSTWERVERERVREPDKLMKKMTPRICIDKMKELQKRSCYAGPNSQVYFVLNVLVGM